MSEDKKTITIITDKGKDVRSVPVTGAWGGPSTDLSVVIAHCFTEYNTIPSIIDVEVDESGSGKPNEGRRISRGDVTREIQVTLVMAPDSAIRLGKFLIEKGEIILEARNR